MDERCPRSRRHLCGNTFPRFRSLDTYPGPPHRRLPHPDSSNPRYKSPRYRSCFWFGPGYPATAADMLYGPLWHPLRPTSVPEYQLITFALSPRKPLWNIIAPSLLLTGLVVFRVYSSTRAVRVSGIRLHVLVTRPGLNDVTEHGKCDIKGLCQGTAKRLG